jgi:hypothetical protein
MASTPKRDDMDVIANQEHWNNMLDRLMAAHERKAKRRAIDDDQWDQEHEDQNR